MHASKHKNAVFVEKTSTVEFQRKKKMPFKHFEFLERFEIGVFLIPITQLEEAKSTGKVFILPEI